MPEILKNICNFILRCLLDFLRAKSKAGNFGWFTLYSYYFITCCLTAPWPTFDGYRGNIITHPILITAFGLSIFCPKVTGRNGVSTPNQVPSGLWSQCHNPLIHSPQIAKNVFPSLVHSIFKIWKCSQYPKQL